MIAAIAKSNGGVRDLGKIDTADIEKIYPVAEAEINKALKGLERVIGADDIDFEEEEIAPNHIQSTAAFAFDFDFDAVIYNETFPGIYGDSGFPHLGRDEAREKQLLQVASLREHHESNKEIVARALTGVTGHTQISDAHVAWHQYTCDGCTGHGQITCGRCNGNGEFRCTRCIDGHPNCLHCGGRGRISTPGQYSSSTICSPCMGRGWFYCDTCQGSMRETCSGCSGHGANNCGRCNATGALTDFYGVKYSVTATLKGKETELIPAATKRIVQWIKDGLPSRFEKDYKRPSLSPSKISAIASKVDGRRSHSFDFTLSVPQIVIDLKFEGHPLSVRHILLDKSWVHFTPFLDTRVEKVAALVQNQKDTTPEQILKTLENYPALRNSVKNLWRGDPSFCTTKWAETVSEEFHGAVKPEKLYPIMETYNTSARRLQKKAVGNTIFMPMLATMIIWVITQMMDFPGSIRSGLDQILVIPYVSIPFFVTRWMVKSKAKRVIKKETGQTADVKLGLRGHVVPIAAGLIFFLTWYFQIDLIAIAENVARATLSQR